MGAAGAAAGTGELVKREMEGERCRWGLLWYRSLLPGLALDSLRVDSNFTIRERLQRRGGGSGRSWSRRRAGWTGTGSRQLLHAQHALRCTCERTGASLKVLWRSPPVPARDSAVPFAHVASLSGLRARLYAWAED